MDYGLQHVLGNLVSGDYDALISSDEFSRVRKGLKDDSEEILCRYCEKFAYRVDPIARNAGRVFDKLREFRRSISHIRSKLD